MEIGEQHRWLDADEVSAENLDAHQILKVQDVAHYAVIYSGLGVVRVMKTASTQLGAIRHALNLVEWLTHDEDDGIKVTLGGAVVVAAAREAPNMWTLVLRTEKGRRAQGRLSIYREVNP